MVFFIFGLLRPFTVLGLKLDECSNCGQVCDHVVGRRTNWGHFFWIPVLFLGFSHGMICSICGAWTSLSRGSVRAAMKSGKLPLERARPHSPEVLAAAAAESGEPVQPPSRLFDPFVVNPKRGGWDLYLKAWPVLVVAILVGGAISAALSPGSAVEAGNGPAPSPGYVAHHCWEALDDSITGCLMANGTVDGETSDSPIMCYFNEPMPSGRLMCRYAESSATAVPN